jgi:hypothetical protein
MLKETEVVISQRWRKAQSAVEYAILFCVVVSALLLLQAMVRRGFSGNLREAADRMGEQYSPTNTVLKSTRTMLNDQYINEEVNTTKTVEGSNIGIDKFISGFGYTPKYVGDMGIYSYTERLDQKFTSKTEQKTESLNKEKFRKKEFEETTWPDVEDRFPIP